MANEYKKDLTIVAVGPLTNVAKAIQKDPQFAEKVGRIVIMGGAVLLPGNVSQLAEGNIYQDPNAANIVFTSKAKVTMVGLDVTMRTIFTKKKTQNWRNIGTVSAKKYADMVDFYINAYATTQPELNGCALHDPLAVAVAVDPSLVQTFEMNMKVGTTEADFGRTIGKIFVDEGAAEAIHNKGSSLLPAGVKDISGKFSKGDLVEIVDVSKG